MARITEIATNVFQITEYVSQLDMQFNHFVIRDDEPLLFHTGFRRMFPHISDAVAKLIDPSRLRWISFSHFEADECGSLNEWLAAAPHAEVVSGPIGTYVNLQDFAIREPRALMPGEVIETGSRRYRFIPTAHVPHGWDSGVLFEETQRVLFCSDLFHQNGDLPPVTNNSVMERAQQSLRALQAGPFANYVPVNEGTDRALATLADLRPCLLAAMHGSAFTGDGAQAIRDLAIVLRQELGTSAAQPKAASQP